MTQEQALYAAELVRARVEIMEFLGSRNPEEPYLKRWAESQHRRDDVPKILDAEVIELTISDAPSCERTHDEQGLTYWYLPRGIVEHAMRCAVIHIDRELKALGVE